MTRRPLRNKNGMALVMTILVVALLTMTVVDFFHATWVQSALAASFRNETQALYAARSGQKAARLILLEDAKNTLARDSLHEDWAQSIPIPLGGEYAFVSMRDESGKIDLNMLTTGRGYPDEKWIAVFTRMLKHLKLDPELAGAVVDWIDSNSEVTYGGAEEGYYMSLDKPYHCKNAKLDSIDELYMVKGFTPEAMKKLRPHITVWSSGKVNVNTATELALMGLDGAITRKMAQDIMRLRISRPFTKREDIKNAPGMAAIYPNIALLIGVSSDVYMADSSSTINEATKTIRAVYKRSKVNTQTLYYKVF